MQILDHTDVLSLLCIHTKKWGMYFSFCYPKVDDPFAEIIKAAPFLKEQYQILSDGEGFILFTTRDEMEQVYELAVGDDGPTRSNSYNGPARVYVLTCSPTGSLKNENT